MLKCKVANEDRSLDGYAHPEDVTTHSQAACLRNDVSSGSRFQMPEVSASWSTLWAQVCTLPVTHDGNSYPCLRSLPSSKHLNVVSSW